MHTHLKTILFIGPNAMLALQGKGALSVRRMKTGENENQRAICTVWRNVYSIVKCSLPGLLLCERVLCVCVHCTVPETQCSLAGPFIQFPYPDFYVGVCACVNGATRELQFLKMAPSF